MTGNICERGRF